MTEKERLEIICGAAGLKVVDVIDARSVNDVRKAADMMFGIRNITKVNEDDSKE